MLRGNRSLRGLLSTTWPCDRIRDVALDVTWGSLVTRSPVDDVAFVTLNMFRGKICEVDPRSFQGMICDIEQVPGSFRGRICDVEKVP